MKKFHIKLIFMICAVLFLPWWLISNKFQEFKWNTVEECHTFEIFLFSDPNLAWNIWFEYPFLLPVKWQCQNSPSEENFIEKYLIFEHCIFPRWEEKTSIFSKNGYPIYCRKPKLNHKSTSWFDICSYKFCFSSFIIIKEC